MFPWEHREHAIVQMAANNPSSSAFRMNDALNGLNVSLTRHNGSHSEYNKLIGNKLNDIMTDLQSSGQLNPTNALNKIQQLANDAKNAINYLRHKLTINNVNIDENWFKQIVEIKNTFAVINENHNFSKNFINTYTVVDTLSTLLRGDEVIITDAGS